ncbi:hypothetical protein [Piscirickettsia litoralis]|nr:hypothetical protein [Piscirickettsia litoralis]
MIKVLVVDDSEEIQKLLTEIFDQDSEIQVVATATDAYDARQKIEKIST